MNSKKFVAAFAIVLLAIGSVSCRRRGGDIIILGGGHGHGHGHGFGGFGGLGGLGLLMMSSGGKYGGDIIIGGKR